MRVVRWVIVLLTVAVCGGAAAFLTIMLLKTLGLAEGYRYTGVAVVALMVGWFLAPKLSRWAGPAEQASTVLIACQASLASRPAGSLDRPRRPLSRGFETASYPTAPPVSYQINRQLSGWILPPLVFRAFGAH